MTRPNENFHFDDELILKTQKLGLIRLSVYNSVLNIPEKINKIGNSPNYQNKSFNIDSSGEVSIKYDVITKITPGSYEVF